MTKHAYNNQRVWEAAYAAAFVEQFDRSFSERVSRRERNPFDDALEGIAETAITIADEAVRQLDEWAEQEES